MNEKPWKWDEYQKHVVSMKAAGCEPFSYSLWIEFQKHKALVRN